MLLNPGPQLPPSLLVHPLISPLYRWAGVNMVRRHIVWESKATLGTKAHSRLPKGQSFRAVQPALHVSLLVGSRHSCGQLGTTPKGQEPKKVGGTSSCCLGPLGSHSQHCCSSSSQTMRVIFSQCFNTSQLASVQGGSPPPPSPPRWQAGPAHRLRCADSASLFVYLVVSAQLLLTNPQNYNTFKRK